jgi:hypothetical protein
VALPALRAIVKDEKVKQDCCQIIDAMNKLDTLDLCARLDTMKALCDRLEALQDEPQKYRQLVDRIRVEADAVHAMVCDVTHHPRGKK